MMSRRVAKAVRGWSLSIFALALLAPVSCCRSPDADAVIEAVGRDIGHAREFREAFGDRPLYTEFITYLTGAKGQTAWNGKVGLYGRYVISVRCDIDVRRARGIVEVVPVSPPFVQVVEIGGIGPEPGGQFAIGISNGWEVDDVGWRRLIESGGDLGTVVPDVRRDDPIPGFEEHWDKS